MGVYTAHIQHFLHNDHLIHRGDVSSWQFPEAFFFFSFFFFIYFLLSTFSSVCTTIWTTSQGQGFAKATSKLSNTQRFCFVSYFKLNQKMLRRVKKQNPTPSLYNDKATYRQLWIPSFKKPVSGKVCLRRKCMLETFISISLKCSTLK